jgi:hypothetical protein
MSDDILDQLRQLSGAANIVIGSSATAEIVRLRRLVFRLERDLARARTRWDEGAISNQPGATVGGFRNGDPGTSVAAALSLNVEKVEGNVMLTIGAASTPLNCSEISVDMKCGRDTVSPRMKSLRARKMVEPMGYRPGPRGRKQIAYVLTARGKDAIRRVPLRNSLPGAAR